MQEVGAMPFRGLFYLLFPNRPPRAVVCVAEDLLARPQGRGVVTAGRGANINSFGHLQRNLLHFLIPKLFVGLKSALEMLEARALSVKIFLMSSIQVYKQEWHKLT